MQIETLLILKTSVAGPNYQKYINTLQTGGIWLQEGERIFKCNGPPMPHYLTPIKWPGPDTHLLDMDPTNITEVKKV